MGVNGLLRLLQPISVPRQLEHFQGRTLGVDGYAWLHRAAASCAEDLVKNVDTVKLVQSIDRRVRLYEAAGVNLYFVFDGAHIDMKARISAQRRKARAQAKAAFLSNQSQNVMGGVSITAEHAAMVTAYLKARGIRFIVAPYEADAQLVWLEKNGYVDAILSEDSDLLVFGAQRLLTKADGRTGDCIEVSAEHLPPHFTPEGMRALAIVSGCDYSQGVQGLGPVKTSALVKSFGGDLAAICASLMRSGKIDQAFVDEANRADAAFQHQRVWDPKLCNIVHLSDPDGSVPVHLLSDAVIGPLLARPDAHRIARCVVDPNNPERMLPVSPAVAQFVNRLFPFAKASPSRYASAPSVRSMVDRRLQTPSSMQGTSTRSTVSPFFKQKPLPAAARFSTDTDKENTCALPTPPASMRSSTVISNTPLKRNSGDNELGSALTSQFKALRTDTAADVSSPTPLRSSHPNSQKPVTIARPHAAAAPASLASVTISAAHEQTSRTSTAASRQSSSAEYGHATDRSMADKLVSLQKFAYTKS